MQRRLNESTEKYKKVKKTAMNLPIMLKSKKTSVSIESVRKNAQWKFYESDQKWVS